MLDREKSNRVLSMTCFTPDGEIIFSRREGAFLSHEPYPSEEQFLDRLIPAVGSTSSDEVRHHHYNDKHSQYHPNNDGHGHTGFVCEAVVRSTKLAILELEGLHLLLHNVQGHGVGHVNGEVFTLVGFANHCLELVETGVVGMERRFLGVLESVVDA